MVEQSPVSVEQSPVSVEQSPVSVEQSPVFFRSFSDLFRDLQSKRQGSEDRLAFCFLKKRKKGKNKKARIKTKQPYLFTFFYRPRFMEGVLAMSVAIVCCCSVCCCMSRVLVFICSFCMLL